MKIWYSSKFIKQFKKLPEDVKDLFAHKEDMFKVNLFDDRLKFNKLHGKFSGLYSFSIDYRYRVICNADNIKEIIFLAIGNHDIYEK